MIKIGEKLNSSIPASGAAIAARDEDRVLALMERQLAAGADYLDVNAAVCGAEEAAALLWLARLALQRGAGLSLDSPSPALLERVIPQLPPCALLINSLTAGGEWGNLPRLLAARGAGVVLLPLSGGKMPASGEQRVANAEAGLTRLLDLGLSEDQVYVDIICEALSANEQAGAAALAAAAQLRQDHPRLHLVCGLSNISFGLPGRAYINAAFLRLARDRGLDAVICDVNSPSLAPLLQGQASENDGRDGADQLAALAEDVVWGRDRHCLKFIRAFRQAFPAS